MSPASDDGGLIITFPRAWTAEQRLEFMADVARALPRERWAHVGELMCTDSIDATATERRAVFARLTKERFAMHVTGAPLALAVAAPPRPLCLPAPAYELTIPSTRSTTP